MSIASNSTVQSGRRFGSARSGRGGRWVAFLALACGAALPPFASPGAARADEAKAAPAPLVIPADWRWGTPEQQAKLDALVGKPMPELSLDGWVNGGPLTADALKGKVVVVDVWATWCGPCIASIPHNNEMFAKYHDQGVELVGVCSSQQGQERMDDVARAKGIKYPIAKDPGSKTATAWGVMWFPTYAVVDRAGVLRTIGLKPGAVEKVVEMLLKEPAPAK